MPKTRDPAVAAMQIDQIVGRMRELAAKLQAVDVDVVAGIDSFELAEIFYDLDDAMQKGADLPADWTRDRACEHCGHAAVICAGCKATRTDISHPRAGACSACGAYGGDHYVGCLIDFADNLR